MSEGIFGKNADLAQRLKDRIAFHANEHRHTYEIGKGVMDALVLDLLADFRDAGGVILPVKPNGTVWLMFELYDTVVLLEDDPDTGVKAGTEGTVVYIQGNGEAYTVEFFDENGDTIEDALFKDFLPSQLKKK